MFVLHRTRPKTLLSILLQDCPFTPVSWSRPSSSTSRWKQRQGRDAYARDARVQGLKSRAAFKLIEVRPCGQITAGQKCNVTEHPAVRCQT